MKLSDYVADFLAHQGLKHAFVVSGGASIHLMHSLADHPDIEHVCPHHEQAGAMAADAYARVTGNLGCAIGTSGPGATNMITGIAGAWFDSVPTLFLTGQVTTFRMKGDTGVRQLGFQETEIIPMIRPITKYAVQIKDPMTIRYELEKAVHIARSPRQGPVLVDIPDDLQRGMIEVDELDGFTPEEAETAALPAPDGDQLERALALLAAAERPVIVLGWGVRLAGAAEAARALVERLGMPVLVSWGARDLLPSGHPLMVGTFGTHGTRAGNFTVQNADLVMSIGARLSTRETGSPLSSWARAAKTIVVDVDPAELRKFASFGKPLDLAVLSDAGSFIHAMGDALDGFAGRDLAAWQARIAGWLEAYPSCDPQARRETTVNPYVFIEALSRSIAEDTHIFLDTGCAVAWTMQGFRVGRGQRLYHDFNNTAMGWALPAAVGGSLALGKAPVVCLAGDGSLMMNLQELATVKRHDLPVRLFVLNNDGYSMVRQTQEQWLGSDYVGTSPEGGLAFPSFDKIAEAFDIPHVVIDSNAGIEAGLGEAMAHNGAVLVDVRIPSERRVVPQSRFGYPIEDSEPLLPRDEFRRNMLVEPLPVSLQPLD